MEGGVCLFARSFVGKAIALHITFLNGHIHGPGKEKKADVFWKAGFWHLSYDVLAS